MYKIVLIISYVLVCFKYGNWRNWKAYYPTILYVIIGDLVYNFIFYNYDLWVYERLINHTVGDLLIAFIVFPCSIILFLTFYPKKIWKQAIYIIFWALLNSLLELFHPNWDTYRMKIIGIFIGLLVFILLLSH